MKPLPLFSVCALLVAFGPVARGAAPPSAADIDAARARYNHGVELYDQGRYDEALAELERASDLAPTYRLLYNIGLVKRQLGDAAGALRSLSSYLDSGGAEVPAARRAQVERWIVELTAKVATVTITSNVAGAEIVDGAQIVGTTPLASPAHLNPGTHRLTATKSGYRTDTKAIDLAAGDRVVVDLTLEETRPEPPPAPEALPSSIEPPLVVPAPRLLTPPVDLLPKPPERPPTWIGWTSSGAMAAGAVVTGIAALSESRTLRSDIEDRATPAATIHSAHDSAVTLALVSDVLACAAVGVAGVTLYLTIAASKKGGSSGASAELRAAPGSLSALGRF